MTILLLGITLVLALGPVAGSIRMTIPAAAPAGVFTVKGRV